MQTKQRYTTPEVDILVVQIEGAILEGSPNSANNGYDDDFDMGQI